MKELRYLVFFDKIGYYASKQSKDTEDWTFTRNIGESKRHKTIHGAFIRLDYAKDIPEFKEVNRGILVEQVETKGNKEITKIISKLTYKTMEKLVSEKVIEQPKAEVTTPKKVAGDTVSPHIGTVTTQTTTGDDHVYVQSTLETTEEPIVLKKKRGRPPGSKNKAKENTVVEKPEVEREIPNVPKEDLEQSYWGTDNDTTEEPTEELTSTVDEEESHVKVAKISTEDSFWD